jgi:hypothetical protein
LAIALTMGSLAACAVYEPAPAPAYAYRGGYYYNPPVVYGGVYFNDGYAYHRHHRW